MPFDPVSPIPDLAQTARPWLTRRSGECAFPIKGEGWTLRSCCRPAGLRGYCQRHEAIMRGPSSSSAEDLERDVLSYLERRA